MEFTINDTVYNTSNSHLSQVLTGFLFGKKIILKSEKLLVHSIEVKGNYVFFNDLKNTVFIHPIHHVKINEFKKIISFLGAEKKYIIKF